MWINSSYVLVTWSSPVNENSLIDGYRVFYSVNDCDCKTFSVGITKYNQVILSGLCNTQNYSFFVVSYSNWEYALPSEWSDVAILNAGNLLTHHISYIKNNFIFLCHHQSTTNINSQWQRNHDKFSIK